MYKGNSPINRASTYIIPPIDIKLIYLKPDIYLIKPNGNIMNNVNISVCTALYQLGSFSTAPVTEGLTPTKFEKVTNN